MRPQGPSMPGPYNAVTTDWTNQMPDNKTPKYQYDHYDFGDMLDSAVEAGSKIGSSVLGSIADALAQAGDAMSRPQPDSFSAWKRRLERKWKNGGQSVGVALTAVGWTFTGCFGITAPVLGILTAVGAGPLGLTHDEFMLSRFCLGYSRRSRWAFSLWPLWARSR